MVSGTETPENHQMPSALQAGLSENGPQDDAVDNFAAKKVIIHFQHQSEELNQEVLDSLDQIIRLAAEHADSKVLVEGFTDATGGYAYNLTLSKVRANIVKAYLVYMKVPAERIEVIGNGPENPIASNATPEGRAMNRRVEVTVKRDEG